MNGKSSPYPIERLFNRSGGWYPFLILLFMQLVNSPLMILLTAMPANDNAAFSKAQATSLLFFGSIAILVRNLLLLGQFYLFNKDLVKRLFVLAKPGTIETDPGQEERAWAQANSAANIYIIIEFGEFLVLVLVPTLLFGYYRLHLSLEQITYLSLAALAASLVNLVMGNLILDQLFKPVLEALIPQQFDAQLTGLKGMRIWMKLSIAILGVTVISLLLIVPAAYNQINLLYGDVFRSPRLARDAILIIIKASIGAIVVGMFLSFRLISYFTIPFRKMIEIFQEIETGDFNRRIKVSFSDEFGELNIYFNHMIDRLHVLTSTLEQQVVERTAQLNKVNEELQIELTERKRTEKQLSYSVLHDPLTNLPNRVLFLDRVRHVLERARRNKNFMFAVIFLDLDRFKVVNDTMGHNIGDLLLIESARRLKACLRSQDTVARLGGDEFVILLEDMESNEDYKIVAKRIQQSLDIPADLDGHQVFISVSMGIVLRDPRYELAEDLLRDADIAMYQAKNKGRNRYEVFDTAMLDGVMTHLELENDLRKAHENHEFIVYYQPIVDLETRQIIGFEALLRWQHPTRGLILPLEFIPTLEEMGLIVPVGYWVLDEACRQISAWHVQYPADPPLTVSVNLSTRQCTQTDLVQKLSETLQKYKLDAGSLKLELTETLIVEDLAFTSEILSKLRDLGIEVQIDDFGTGYSSLGYLHTLPINTLKIDRTFINQLGISGSGFEIVRTILALARGLGINVVAEGVETKAQLSILQAMECGAVQGFLLARPADQMEIGALLGKPFNADKD
jgi:diguanylate cyclase (GGDEF)-like protein